MGKGIELPVAVDGFGTEVHEIPTLQGEVVGEAQRMSDLILQGKSPDSAAALVNAKRSTRALESQLLKNKSIVERNVEAFKRAGMKKDAVYKALLETLTDAYKTGPITKRDAEGKRYVAYVKLPDYTARLNAAKQMSLLMGLDPRAEMKVNIASDGKGNSVVSVQLRDEYITIAHMNGDDAIQAYNEMKRNEGNGGYKVISDSADSPVIDGEFTPQVCGGTSHAKRD